jgi:hypothetical protein
MQIVKHSGVKGMRWGVRRNSNRPGGADGKEESEKLSDNRSKLRKNLDSMKRERQWKSIIKEMDKLTTKDIGIVKKRLDLENSLKSLSKSKVGTKKDKEDYLRREAMSDVELQRKVVRLRAKDGLYKSVNDASKEQREMGIKIAQMGATLGVRFAVNKKLGPKDFFDAYKKPKESAKDARKSITNLTIDKVSSRTSNQRLQEILNELRQN